MRLLPFDVQRIYSFNVSLVFGFLLVQEHVCACVHVAVFYRCLLRTKLGFAVCRASSAAHTQSISHGWRKCDARLANIRKFSGSPAQLSPGLLQELAGLDRVGGAPIRKRRLCPHGSVGCLPTSLGSEETSLGFVD